MATIRDDFGRRWEVLKGDPVWEAVTLLQRGQFRDIILPFEVIVTGEYSDLPAINYMPLYEAYKVLDGTDGQQEMGQLLLDRLLLRDCCAYLHACATLGGPYVEASSK